MAGVVLFDGCRASGISVHSRVKRTWCRGAPVAALAAVLAVGNVVAPAAASERVTLDGPWTRLVPGEAALEFGVPRSFDPAGGVVTYVRRFTLESELPNSVALLTFDGVVGQATVTLNGTRLGEHGSYTPFWFEVSGVLRPPGRENELVVVIDDTQDATTVPYADIPWVNYSGIIRNVYIKFSHRAAITRANIQYTFDDASLTSLHAEVAVELAGKPGEEISLLSAILDGQPNAWTVVADSSMNAPVRIGSDGRAKATLPLSVSGYKLWSPDDPKLYFMWVGALHDGLGLDDALQRVGFRDVSVRREDILLNGEPVFLRGITRHDIYGVTGFFGTPEQMEADMIRIKRMGANYVRLIHYPHHPRILELADELGLMVSCEIPAWANFFDEAVRDKLYVLYEEMILRDMNHPSVIMWLSGNARAHPLPYAAEAQKLAKRLDRNRLASYVIDNDEFDPEAVAADVAFIQEADLDVYLKITFWLYYLEFLQDAWANFPKDLPIVIAELGFEGNDREPIIIKDNGDKFDVSEDRQVSALSEMLEGWRPHLPFYAEEHISGLAVYNWQDLDWPDIGRFLPNHVPSIHFGLVYDDREEKQAVETLEAFYKSLPDRYVGGDEETRADVEERFDTAKNLSATVNASFRDSGPSISSSGNRLYLASDGADYIGLPKLLVSDLIDGQWTEPELLDIPQEAEFFAFRRAPCISFDERTLYFTRAILSGIFVAETRIWQASYVNGRWLAPVDMGDAINFPDLIVVTSDPSITMEGDALYFSSDRPGGYGGTDLWVSRRLNDEWQLPENLGAAVNSEHNEAEPSIGPDGRTLYFTSGRPGGVGSSDIWVTHRAADDWSEPKNLGPMVNSAGSDREPEISKDGNFLYFTGIRDGGRGLSDIWFAAVPGAPDPSDVSDAVTIDITTNNAGALIVVTPSDVERRSDGVADPNLVRRFRKGTPITLDVSPMYNGIRFWRWRVDGEPVSDSSTRIARVVTAPIEAVAEYAIPVAAAIVGDERVTFNGTPVSESTRTYMIELSFLDGSTRVIRSGVAWSLDDDSAAGIDPETGVLTPRPMNGTATITLTADVDFAGFDLPRASKTVELAGVVVADPLGSDGPAGSGDPSPTRPMCGAVGFIPMTMTIIGWFVLGLVRPARRLTTARMS
ncbi:MAG: hypothetical protein HOP29_10310 [Phycisphaerales bacterium]|nr:hypothetical protein [Phycisphaerales bacterium]